MENDPIDAGLAAGFGADSEHAPHSVLAAIERIAGAVPRVLLRENADERSPSAAIDPSSNERRAQPRGRGNYQMFGEIARGGMGVVLKGRDLDLGRDVALKVLHRDLARRPDVMQRFVEEAQIGGQLQHPGIVPVYELGLMADERPYFTMKLVKGRTLAALLAERASPDDDRRRWLDVFESICQTLAYAHSRGVIHRDLKPANVMVGAFGEVQVVDWGLAKVLKAGGVADERRARAERASLVATVRTEPGSAGSDSILGSVMGTPAYMSPEQARGEVGKLDERCDVFALGAVLCEILTGSPPYLGEQARTLFEAAHGKLEDAFARLDACDADRELVTLAKHCLAAAPSGRPRNAEVLAQRIHAHVLAVEERARQGQIDAAEARVKAQEERRARKLTLGLAMSVLVTVLVAGGGWMWMQSDKTQRERDAERDVNAALNEATLRRGESKWPEALAAAERAKGLAQAGVVSSEFSTRVEGELVAIRQDAERARVTVQLARDNAELLVALQDLRTPDRESFYPVDWPQVDRNYSEALKRYDIDPFASSDEAAAQSVRVRGADQQLAGALDEWASVKRSARDDAGSQRLVRVSQLVDPDPTRAKLRSAIVAGRVDELTEFAARTDLSMLSISTLQLLGASLSRANRSEPALALYQVAQRLHPDDFTLEINLAREYLLAAPRRVDDSLLAYSAAVALRPDGAQARHELVQALLLQHDHARAEDICREALRRHAELSIPHGDLAEVLWDGHDVEGAIKEFGIALEMEAKTRVASDRNVALWHNTLGNALYEQGHTQAAIDEYRASVALVPTIAATHENLAYRLREAQDWAGASVEFKVVCELDPDNADDHDVYAFVLAKLGDIRGAVAQWRVFIGMSPDDEGALNNLAWFLANAEDTSLRDYELALACAKRATELEPTRAIPWHTYGTALYRNGKWDESIVALDKSIELAKQDDLANVFVFLAMDEQRLGHAAAAREWFDKTTAAMRVNSSTDAELARFCAEATALLGTESAASEAPSK